MAPKEPSIAGSHNQNDEYGVATPTRPSEPGMTSVAPPTRLYRAAARTNRVMPPPVPGSSGERSPR